MENFPRRSSRSGALPSLPSWMVGALVSVFILATLLSGYLVFTTVRDFVAGWKVTGDNPGRLNGPSQNNASGPNVLATPHTAGILPQKWSGTERVTILLLGIDRRQGEEEKGYLTDSIMLVTVDPVAKTAAMLSVPRDLWVEIPGFDNNTINTANRSGDYYDYPGGGPALASKTVQHNFGVTVNYYVRLDFTAFETFIDAIGGIDVQVVETIDDPDYPNGSYGFEPFYLAAGPQHLNGHDALRYARTRHNSSDIDRAKRQQEVVLAVRQRILDQKMLPRLLGQVPSLYQTLNDSVQTNLTLEQAISLALLAQDITPEKIQHEVIDYRYVLEETSPTGRDILIPIRDKIRELRDSLFTSSVAAVPVTAGGDELSLLKTEAAQVAVLNGASVEGLARSTADWLIPQGLTIATVDTADSSYAATVIIDYNGRKPYTTHWLARTFNAQVLSRSDPNSTVDVAVILGANWQVPGN